MSHPLAHRDSVFLYSFRRPYFDLGAPAGASSYNSYGPLLAYSMLDTDWSNGIERIPGEGFRLNLLAESGLTGYAKWKPQELDESLRTPSWQRLCELTEQYHSLALKQQAKVLRLLICLGFYRLVLQLAPPESSRQIVDEETAQIACHRAFARYVLHMQKNVSYTPDDFQDVLKYTPSDSFSRHFAAKILLIFAAKVSRNMQHAINFRDVAHQYVESLPSDFDTFSRHLVVSRFYRSASFVPFLQGDMRTVEKEMALAEEYARNAPVDTEEKRIIVADLLVSTLESRMREAMAVGDFELAHARIQKAAEIDPWDPKVLIELGEILYKRGNVIEAARVYLKGAHLGPPGTSLAYFLAGFCYERAGEMELAIDCHLKALRFDPSSVSATLRLLQLAQKTGQLPLVRWAEQKAEFFVRVGYLTPGEWISNVSIATASGGPV